MSRGEREQFEQDNVGNSRRKLDNVRASEGRVAGGSDGLEVISQDSGTGTIRTLYSLPTRADEVYVRDVRAFVDSVVSNSQAILYELELNGSGSIVSSQRRSVDLDFSTGATDTYDYRGEAFDRAIGVEAGFRGQVAVGVTVDHREETK